MNAPRRSLMALALAGTVASAGAFDYRSLAEPAVMFDAPSAKARPMFVVTRYTPVEVVVALEGWLKVRDASGGLAWVERRQVAEQRMVAVKLARAQIRAQPEESAPLVFEAEKDVVLELVEAAPPGWAKVKHRDGQLGYVRGSQIWGL